MPLPLLALAALPAVAKGALGLFQANQHVDRTDTTTPAEREQLAIARQAGAATLPGLGTIQSRLAQTQASAVQNAQLGAGSSGDFLAASAAAAGRRQQGELQLNTQQGQYHDQATRQLGATLSAYARHQQADTAQAAQANAQLKGAALQNLGGALSDGASVAAYGLSGAAERPGATPVGAVDELTPLPPRQLSTTPPASARYPTPFEGQELYGPYRRSGSYASYY
jgi:hypothetical protein